MTKTRSALYAGDGVVFSHYALDLEQCSLAKLDSLRLSGNIQYAWPHPSLPVVYVACSTQARGSGPEYPGEPLVHELHALRLETESDVLSLHGPSIALRHRPIHISTDQLGAHVLVAYNNPANVDVITTNADGTLGDVVKQRPDIDFGVHPHQVRVTPDNRRCIVVARGNPPEPEGWWAAKGPQADPGALKIFEYDDGVLGDLTSITFGDGSAFGPRHLDFHPTKPWVYVSVETQNEVVVFRSDDDGMIEPIHLQRLSGVKDPESLHRQVLGPVHVHPRGHVVYFTNRVYQQMPAKDGVQITPPGSENSIVVYAIDEDTGLLTEIQRVDTGGVNPRTFSIDPSMTMMVVANSVTRLEKDGDQFKTVLKNLATFEIADDGRLTWKHTYHVAAEPKAAITWAGVVAR